MIKGLSSLGSWLANWAREIVYKPFLFISILCLLMHPNITWLFCIAFTVGVDALLVGFVRKSKAQNGLTSLKSLLLHKNGKQPLFKEVNAAQLLNLLFGQNLAEAARQLFKNPAHKLSKGAIESPLALTDFVKALIPDDETDMLSGSLMRYGPLYQGKFIFVNEKTENLNLVQKYKILHEFGHATLYNGMIIARRKKMIIECIALLVLALFSLTNYWLLIPLAASATYFCLKNWNLPTKEAETHADRWAIAMLPVAEREKALSQLVAAYSIIVTFRQGQNTGFETLKEPAAGNPTPILIDGYKHRIKFFRSFLNRKKELGRTKIRTHVALTNSSHYVLFAVLAGSACYMKPQVFLVYFYAAFIIALKVFFDRKAGNEPDPKNTQEPADELISRIVA
jgi:hypothetical protein